MTRIAAFACLMCISGLLWADQTYVCTYGQKERIISVVYRDQETRSPCEVRYSKQCKTETVWTAESAPAYCEARAQALMEKQVGWGWRCAALNAAKDQQSVLIQEPAMVVGSDTLQASIAFAQAMAAVSAIKVAVTEFYYQQGAFPDSLTDIGMKASDMTTSSHLSDLRIVNGGLILIQGNKQMGLNSVVRLTPKITLGGSALEWQCSTSALINTNIPCRYESALSFNWK